MKRFIDQKLVKWMSHISWSVKTKRLATIVLTTVVVVSVTISAYAQENAWQELMVKSSTLYQRGEYSEAAKLAEEALKVAEETYDTNHPNVGFSMFALATICQAQGKYAEAEPFYRQSLRIFEKALGPDHPQVAAVLRNMAECCRNLGKKDEAEKLEARAIKIRSKK